MKRMKQFCHCIITFCVFWILRANNVSYIPGVQFVQDFKLLRKQTIAKNSATTENKWWPQVHYKDSATGLRPCYSTGLMCLFWKWMHIFYPLFSSLNNKPGSCSVSALYFYHSREPFVPSPPPPSPSLPATITNDKDQDNSDLRVLQKTMSQEVNRLYHKFSGFWIRCCDLHSVGKGHNTACQAAQLVYTKCRYEYLRLVMDEPAQLWVVDVQPRGTFLSVSLSIHCLCTVVVCHHFFEMR